jgi:hypothetical protein
MLFHQTVVALYHQACRFLKLVHHLHFSFEKSKIERTMQYIKTGLNVSMISSPTERRNVN